MHKKHIINLDKVNKKQKTLKKHLSNYPIGATIKPSTGNVTGNVTDNVPEMFQSALIIYLIMKERGISK